MQKLLYSRFVSSWTVALCQDSVSAKNDNSLSYLITSMITGKYLKGGGINNFFNNSLFQELVKLFNGISTTEKAKHKVLGFF